MAAMIRAKEKILTAKSLFALILSASVSLAIGIPRGGPSTPGLARRIMSLLLGEWVGKQCARRLRHVDHVSVAQSSAQVRDFKSLCRHLKLLLFSSLSCESFDNNMIEIFKSRRYIGLTIVLIIICLIVMILEGLLTTDKPSFPGEHNVIGSPHHPADGSADVLSDEKEAEKHKSDLRTACWLHEDFHVVIKCSKCSELEAKVNFTACTKTGFIQQIRCKSGLQVVRSCVHESAVASFWKFELSMILMSALACYACHRREAKLKKAAMERMNKQLSCGV